MHFTRAVEDNGLYSWWSDHTAAKRGGGDGGQQPVQEHLHPAEQELLLPVQLEETSEVRHTVSNSVQCSRCLVSNEFCRIKADYDDKGTVKQLYGLVQVLL